MKLIKPNTHFFGEVLVDYKSAIEFIEVAGRTCYKSEDKITGDSAENFVRKLINAKPYPHLAMVEHSNFVVKRNIDEIPIDALETTDYMIGKYLNYVLDGSYIFIGGNLTAWYQRGQELGWKSTFLHPFYTVYSKLFNLPNPPPYEKISDADYWKICLQEEVPNELHRYSVKFVCDRGVSHELVRHRPCSFAQESTRFVNYKDKDIEFIEPWWWETEQSEYLKQIFTESCFQAERIYKDFIAFGRSPQAARAVLTNALKTEIIVTADLKEWNHIFNLRTVPGVQPDFLRLSVPLKEVFVTKGLL